MATKSIDAAKITPAQELELAREGITLAAAAAAGVLAEKLGVPSENIAISISPKFPFTASMQVKNHRLDQASSSISAVAVINVMQETKYPNKIVYYVMFYPYRIPGIGKLTQEHVRVGLRKLPLPPTEERSKVTAAFFDIKKGIAGTDRELLEDRCRIFYVNPERDYWD